MLKLYIDKWKIPNEYLIKNIKPTIDKLKNLEIDDYVKISNGNEDFWVEITKIYHNSIYGIIRNNLYLKKKYSYGDLILFGKHQICDVYKN